MNNMRSFGVVQKQNHECLKPKISYQCEKVSQKISPCNTQFEEKKSYYCYTIQLILAYENNLDFCPHNLFWENYVMGSSFLSV